MGDDLEYQTSANGSQWHRKAFKRNADLRKYRRAQVKLHIEPPFASRGSGVQISSGPQPARGSGREIDQGLFALSGNAAGVRSAGQTEKAFTRRLAPLHEPMLTD